MKSQFDCKWAKQQVLSGFSNPMGTQPRITSCSKQGFTLIVKYKTGGIHIPTEYHEVRFNAITGHEIRSS
jgi:hypothetical protein